MFPTFFCYFARSALPKSYKSDNMQRTQTMLQPRLAAQAAAANTTRVLQACGVLLWLYRTLRSAIAHRHLSLSLLPCCCACVCGVSCALRKVIIWVFGNVVYWSRCPFFLYLRREFDPRRDPCLFFSPFCFCTMYVTQIYIPQTTSIT